MKKIVRVYNGFKEAEEADKLYYKSLSPDECLRISRELLQNVHGDLRLLPDIRESKYGKIK